MTSRSLSLEHREKHKGAKPGSGDGKMIDWASTRISTNPKWRARTFAHDSLQQMLDFWHKKKAELTKREGGHQWRGGVPSPHANQAPGRCSVPQCQRSISSLPPDMPGPQFRVIWGQGRSGGPKLLTSPREVSHHCLPPAPGLPHLGGPAPSPNGRSVTEWGQSYRKSSTVSMEAPQCTV